MTFDVSDLESAIAARRSTRRYTDGVVSADRIEMVRELVADMPRLRPDIDVRAFVVEDGAALRSVMSGLIGSYGKPSAPHFVLVTSAEVDGCYENVGFAVEHAVLGMTVMGLATCWIGGQATREVFEAAVPDIPADHVPVVVIAFGESPSALRKQGQVPSRKSMDVIAPDGIGRFGDLLEAARLAPSAGNTQPSRFFVDGDRIDAFAEFKTPFIYRARADHLQLMNRVDVGIALAHISIAARGTGRDAAIDLTPRGHESFTYIASVVVGSD